MPNPNRKQVLQDNKTPEWRWMMTQPITMKSDLTGELMVLGLFNSPIQANVVGYDDSYESITTIDPNPL